VLQSGSAKRGQPPRQGPTSLVWVAVPRHRAGCGTYGAASSACKRGPAAPSRPHISYERCSAGPSRRTGPHTVPPSARAKIASGTSRSASLTGIAVLCLRTGRDHLQGGHQRVRRVGLHLEAMGSPWSSSGRTRSSSSCSAWTQVVGVVARVRDCLGTPVPRRRQVRFVRSAVF